MSAGRTTRRRRADGPKSDWRGFLAPERVECTKTIAELAEVWLDQQERAGRKSMRDARSAVHRHVTEPLGHLDARALDLRTVEAWIRGMEADDYASASIRRHASYLSSILTLAFEMGAAEVNVMRQLPPGTLPSVRQRDPGRAPLEVLTPQEILALVGMGPGGTAPPFYRRLFWGLLLFTGARFGEGAGLKWCDITPRKPLSHVFIRRSWACREGVMRETTKTGQTRGVPLHPVLAELIDHARHTWWPETFGRAPRDEDLVAPYPLADARRSRSKARRPGAPVPWHETTALKRWREDLEAVGIARPPGGPHRLHSTRHTFISTMIRAGVLERVIMQMTHTPESKRAFDAYAHPDWSTLCDAVLRLVPEPPEPTGRTLRVVHG